MLTKKVETNYVIEGEAEVILQNEDGSLESRTYKKGDGWCVPLKTKHRVFAGWEMKLEFGLFPSHCFFWF